jgi:hypothetical protein
MLRLTLCAALLAALADAKPAAPDPYPFAQGETLQYDARLGIVPIGNATARVAGTAQVRGVQTFVLTLSAEGGPPGFAVRYDLTSWPGVSRFVSRRFQRRIDQAGRVTEQRFDIVPDSGLYRQEGSPQAWVAPPEPLDELAFVYWLRTAPLAVGTRTTVSRYFRNGFNPVTVSVTGRETVTLGSGEAVSCLAVTLAAAGSSSEVCLSDDRRRLPVQLRLPLPFGWVTLRLQAAPARAGR